MLGSLDHRTAPAGTTHRSLLRGLPPVLLRYGAPVLAVAAAALLRVVLWPVLGNHVEYLLFWPVLILAVWYGGFWPGVWATGLSALAAVVLFYRPVTTIGLGQSFGSFMFILLGIGCCLLVERAREARRARDTNYYHRSLLEASLDPLVAIGPDGTITDVNAATEQATGAPRQELVGRDFCDYFTEPARARAAYEEVFRAGFIRDYPLEIRHRDGHATPVLYNASVYREESGKAIGAFAAARDVSERKRREDALRESEERFRATFEQAAVGMAHVGLNGRWLRVNERLCAITGYSREELLGLTFQDITYPEDLAADLQHVRRMLDRAIAMYQIEKRYVRKDGSLVWVHLTVSLVADAEGKPRYFIAVVEDISERKQVEAEILRLNETLDQRVQERTAAVERQALLINAINQAQAEFISAESSRQSFDRVLEHLLRMTGSEYGFLDELLHTADGQPYLVARAITNIAWNEASQKMYDQFMNGTLTFTNRKSLYGVVMSTGRPLIANDAAHDPRRSGVPPGHPPLRAFLGIPLISNAKEFVGMIGLANRPGGYDDDVIAYLEPLVAACANLIAAMKSDQRRKQAELDLRQAYDTLEQRVAERTRELAERTLALERSNKELEQFAYVASHDLQEPLRMVASYVELLAQRYQGKLDEKADKFIHYIVDGATRMQTLINDLLTFSRVTTRAQPFTRTQSETVLAEVLDNLQKAIAEKGATVTHDPLPDVLVDPTQFAQVLQNLIGNAIKFCNGTPQVHVQAERQANAWVFAVRDNGIGIAPEHVGRLFVLFQRLHRRDQYPGTGIGLAVCKKIVERHGGRIWLESTPGTGSTFYFSLPLREEHRP